MPAPSPRQLARWVLLGLVIAGVLAMHVLGDHDTGGTAEPMAMAMHSTPGAAAPAMAMTRRPAGEAPAVAPAALTAGHGGPVSAMDCCVLFLTAGGALLVLLRTGTSAPAVTFSADWIFWNCARRRPPAAGPLRIRLCVLRV